MRKALAVLAAGLVALVLLGGAAVFWPVHWLPDVALLATVAAALVLGPAEGLLVAAALGFSADMLSGTLLGQQAMLCVLAFAVTRLFAAQLDLRRGLALSIFVGMLVLASGALLVLQSRFFLGLPFEWSETSGLLARALITALFAVPVGGAARAIVERLEESQARREMRLDTRRPAL